MPSHVRRTRWERMEAPAKVAARDRHPVGDEGTSTSDRSGQRGQYEPYQGCQDPYHDGYRQGFQPADLVKALQRKQPHDASKYRGQQPIAEQPVCDSIYDRSTMAAIRAVPIPSFSPNSLVTTHITMVETIRADEAQGRRYDISHSISPSNLWASCSRPACNHLRAGGIIIIV